MAGTDFGDDAVLVDRLRGGDEAAFAWLLDRYSGPLRRLARSYVATDALADDAVQETWTAVITGIDRFEGRSSVKTWLYGILVNVARARGVKEHRSTPFSSLGDEVARGEPSVDPDRFRPRHDRFPGHWARPPVPWDEHPEDRLLAEETVAFVRAAIGELPPNQRAVITLRDVEGWTGEEVCNALEISETNQRVLLHRARTKVRAALAAHLEDTR